jgi:hypothetical protein
MDAGPIVSVRMIYQRWPETSAPGTCPTTYVQEDCYVTKQMPRSKAESLMASYLPHGCTNEWIADGGHIWCINNCPSQSGSCTLPDGGTEDFSKRVCTFPPYTVEPFCDWQPP